MGNFSLRFRLKKLEGLNKSLAGQISSSSILVECNMYAATGLLSPRAAIDEAMKELVMLSTSSLECDGASP